MKNGVIIINKEIGPTSQGVVNRVKRLLGAKKAGHTGTLDPMATGVLPVLIERGVKASEFMLSSDKHYIATLLLGLTTDTEDVTGETLTESDAIPTESEVLSAVESFVGRYMQTPPMYSALKVSGKKLCDLAREGKEIEREPRRITVHSIKAEKTDDTRYTLDVHCSKGTYIRTLCADIGKKLGTGGCMEALERSRAADFTLNDAHTLSELEAMNEEERESLIVPVERIFMKLPAVTLPPFFARLARCGLEIYLKKIGKAYEVGTMLRIYDEKGFFAIGEVREFEDGAAIKPVRQFDI
jgi:tRNA pseudouridine55 synthase